MAAGDIFSIAFKSDVFDAGKPLEDFASDKFKALITVEWFSGRKLEVRFASPQTISAAQFETTYNYNDFREQLADFVEKSILEVKQNATILTAFEVAHIGFQDVDQI